MNEMTKEACLFISLKGLVQFCVSVHLHEHCEYAFCEGFGIAIWFRVFFLITSLANGCIHYYSFCLCKREYSTYMFITWKKYNYNVMLEMFAWWLIFPGSEALEPQHWIKHNVLFLLALLKAQPRWFYFSMNLATNRIVQKLNLVWQNRNT